MNEITGWPSISFTSGEVGWSSIDVGDAAGGGEEGKKLTSGEKSAFRYDDMEDKCVIGREPESD